MGDVFEADVAAADAVLAKVVAAGFDVEELAAGLQREGVAAFEESWAPLPACVSRRVAHLTSKQES